MRAQVPKLPKVRTMESASLKTRMAVCALLLCLLTGAKANESEPEIEVELDTRAIRDFYPKDPNLTSEKQLVSNASFAA